MDHELKQRLIGAVVVTALCAIFIPMLFDDPVDNSGKLVSELSIPAPVDSGAPGANGRIVPSSADQVLGLPYPEPLSIENVSDGLESTGVEDEPEKQDRSGESLYAESEGYTEDGNTKELVERPLSADVADDDGKSTQLSDSRIKAAVKKPEKVQQVVETIKPVTVKKPVQAPVTVKQSPPKPPTVTAEAKNPVTAPKASAKLVRWYIQLGSFSKRENAITYWDSLREQGLPASLDTVQTDKGTIYRLRIGPELDQKKAAAMKARLEKKNIKAVLMSE
jgi:DedD protein